MNSHFRRNVATTSSFFALRFVVSLVVSVAYIFVAATIQYSFVSLLGESTFNYIVGGLLSLLLGVLVCERGGALVFMFVRGWHVSALAYANKIRKAKAPAITVGMKAFSKNIVGFGAVYGVKVIAKNLLSDFDDKLWDLLSGVPLAQDLRKFSENPIVERLAGDVLNYGFDATIFYLIKHPPEDVNDVPSTVVEGLKKYLYCLPSIMLTSVTTYFLFSLLPRIVKWMLIIWIFVSQGFVAGILITVLMWPIFYILNNSFFYPLTMIMFISCYSKKCDEEVDTESEIFKFVNSVLEGQNIGTTANEVGEVEEDEQEKPKRTKKAKTPPVEEEPVIDVAPNMSELLGTIKEEPDMGDLLGRLKDESDAPTSEGEGPSWMRSSQDSGVPPRSERESLWEDDGDDSLNNLPLVDEDASTKSLSDILKGFNAQDLGRSVSPSGQSEADSSPSIDDILSGRNDF